MDIFRRREYVSQINKCLGITLYDWQIRYIFGVDTFVPIERATGKTLAHMLKVMLSEGQSIRISGATSQGANLISDYDIKGGVAAIETPRALYNRYYLHEFRRMYNKLHKETSIPLREIIFTI